MTETNLPFGQAAIANDDNVETRLSRLAALARKIDDALKISRLSPIDRANLRWQDEEADLERIDPEIRELLNQLPGDRRASVWLIARNWIEEDHIDPVRGKEERDRWIRAVCAQELKL